jgi:hypothetical protein
MASRSLSDLIPTMQSKSKELLSKCAAQDIEMRPSQTLRDPFEQARLWRQSRTKPKLTLKSLNSMRQERFS